MFRGTFTEIQLTDDSLIVYSPYATTFSSSSVYLFTSHLHLLINCCKSLADCEQTSMNGSVNQNMYVKRSLEEDQRYKHQNYSKEHKNLSAFAISA